MANSTLGNRRLVSAGRHHRSLALAPSAEANWLIPVLLVTTVAASLPLINLPGLPLALLLVTVVILTKRYLIAGGKS